MTEVRKTLASGSAVCKHNMVVLNNEGGEIIPSGSNIAKHLEKELEKAKSQWYPHEASSSTPLRIETGVFVFDFWGNKEAKDMNAVEGEAEVAADSAAASDPFRRQAKKLLDLMEMRKKYHQRWKDQESQRDLRHHRLQN